MHNEQRQEPGLDSTSALVNAPRRRLFKGVGAGAGVLLTVSAKTALGAGVCKSPSAMMSGNTSPRPGDGSTCSGGRSPGFWKVPQHFTYWRTPSAPPTFKPDLTIQACDPGVTGNVLLSDLASPGTLLSEVFPGAPAVSLWWALYKPTDTTTFGAQGQLLRALSAAWLNSLHFIDSATRYPMTAAQVKEIWGQLISTGFYCPTSLTTCSNPWSPAQVISYIEGMYDLNAEVAMEVCKV